LVSEFEESVPSVLLFALSSLRSNAVCVAVLIGLFKSDVLSILFSPTSDFESESKVFTCEADNAVGVDDDDDAFPNIEFPEILPNPSVTLPDVPPPVKPFPALTAVMVPDPLPPPDEPVAERTPPARDRPEPIVIASAAPVPLLERPIKVFEEISASFGNVTALSVSLDEDTL